MKQLTKSNLQNIHAADAAQYQKNKQQQQQQKTGLKTQTYISPKKTYSDGKEYACNAGDLGMEDPLDKEMATHSSILAGEFHGQGNLAGYSL